MYESKKNLDTVENRINGFNDRSAEKHLNEAQIRIE